MEKVVLAPESLFQPANGVRSTRLLVKIHNNYEQTIKKKLDAPMIEDCKEPTTTSTTTVASTTTDKPEGKSFVLTIKLFSANTE